jgi:heme-binding NEAT domain protein
MGSITAPSPANSEIPENAFEINVTGPGTAQPSTPPAETSPDTVTVPDVDTVVGDTTIVAADAGSATAHTTKMTMPRRANIRRTADLLVTKTRTYANRVAAHVSPFLSPRRSLRSGEMPSTMG